MVIRVIKKVRLLIYRRAYCFTPIWQHMDMAGGTSHCATTFGTDGNTARAQCLHHGVPILADYVPVTLVR